MALKRQQEMLATFSMASMTDIVFLLLVFFMVTSSFVFPTAIEVDLPQSTQQTPVKPTNRIYVGADGAYFVVPSDGVVEAVEPDSLGMVVCRIAAAESTAAFAVYGDSEVAYGKVVEVLNIGAENKVKMVLATRPSAPPPSEEDVRFE